MARFPILLCLLALVACTRASGPSSSSEGGEGLPPGTTRRRLVHDGRERSYLVHLPQEKTSAASLPVILNFHGGGGNALGQERYSRMDTLSDEAGFVAVYPEGTGRFGDFLLTWNTGGCCGYALENEVDDVGFVRALLQDLEEIAPVDRRRVYATGLSNGSMMAYRLAAEAPGLVAAIAPVAGAAQAEAIGPVRPVPILHIHSLDDPRALYDGGLGPPFPLTTSRVNHVPVESVLAQWAANNGCGAEPEVVETLESPSDGSGQPHTATHLVYPGCSTDGDVEHWRLTGAGHVWPGGEPGYMESILGPSSDIIDANAEAWAFFRRFRLPD